MSRVVAALLGVLAVGVVVDVARYAREQTALANRWRDDYFDLLDDFDELHRNDRVHH